MKHWLLMLIWLFSFAVNTTEFDSQRYDNSVYVTFSEAKTAIGKIIYYLQNSYVDPELAKPAIGEFKSMLKLGHLEQGIDFYEFKTLVEKTLFNATRDSGFELDYNFIDGQVNQSYGRPSLSTMQVRDKKIARLELEGDYEYSKIYLDFIEDAFVKYADVDVLVIDLRKVEHGSVEFIQKLLGYFFATDIEIMDVKLAGGTQTLKPIATPGVKPFARDFPVYIVTSAFVAGSWEFFAHTLQQNNRAQIVGELTMGVGFIDNEVKVSDNMHLSLTQGVYLAKDDWNEHGVVPDIPVKAKKALDKALELAIGHVEKP